MEILWRQALLPVASLLVAEAVIAASGLLRPPVLRCGNRFQSGEYYGAQLCSEVFWRYSSAQRSVWDSLRDSCHEKRWKRKNDSFDFWVKFLRWFSIVHIRIALGFLASVHIFSIHYLMNKWNDKGIEMVTHCLCITSVCYETLSSVLAINRRRHARKSYMHWFAIYFIKKLTYIYLYLL